MCWPLVLQLLQWGKSFLPGVNFNSDWPESAETVGMQLKVSYHSLLLDPQLLNPPLRLSSDWPQAMAPTKHRQKSCVSFLQTLNGLKQTTFYFHWQGENMMVEPLFTNDMSHGGMHRKYFTFLTLNFMYVYMYINIYAYIYTHSVFPPSSRDRWMFTKQEHLWPWRVWEQPERPHLSLSPWLPSQPAEEHLWG